MARAVRRASQKGKMQGKEAEWKGALPKSVSARPVFVSARERGHRQEGPLSGIWGFIMWIVGVLVFLAVGFGMADGTLQIPNFGIVTVIAGWIVIVLTVLGALLKIIDKLSF